MEQFAVDKEKSLEIVRDILSSLNEDDICLNENMSITDYSDVKIIDKKHKLAVVEINLDLDRNLDFDNITDDFPDDVLECSERLELAIKTCSYNRSDQIEIHHGSSIDDDKISLIAYLHGTSVECDVSYPIFTYVDKYKSWIIIEDFWGAPKGISEYTVTVLDFSSYAVL